MPDHIHTIPVLEALRDPQGCAFCVMHRNLEQSSVQFITGPAYMEDDVRMDTNRTGFCSRHMKAIYDEQNRLGLGLMLHTHLQQLSHDLANLARTKSAPPLFGKDTGGPAAKMAAHLTAVTNDCYVCRKVANTFERYIDTFFYLWHKGGDEGKLIASQAGYCLPHFTQLLSHAVTLGRSKRERFMAEIVPTQLQFIKTMEEDLEWFTLKFDHRNMNEPWKNSKDALPRAMALLGTKG